MTYIFLSNLYWLRCVYWQYLDNRSFLWWIFLRHLLTSREQVPDKWTEWMFFLKYYINIYCCDCRGFLSLWLCYHFSPAVSTPELSRTLRFLAQNHLEVKGKKKNKCALFPDILLFWADHSEFSIDNVIMLRYELWRHGGWLKMFNVHFLSED